VVAQLLSVAEIPQVVKEVYVNLVDLIDTSVHEVQLFNSLDELRDYTISTGKIFPKESAYAGGILKFLLREIFG
jgi:hypothetical protein